MGSKNIECRECKISFQVATGFRSGRLPQLCSTCKPICKRKSEREKHYRWRKANPEKWKAVCDRHNAKRLANPEHLQWKRRNEIKRKYGLEPEQVQALIDAQNNRCKICGRECIYTGRRGNGGAFHIDHDHATNQIRGLLCGNCNTMIGLAKDSPVILKNAARYLEAFCTVTGI